MGGQLGGLLFTPLVVPGVLSLGPYFGIMSAALLLVVLMTAVRAAGLAPRAAAP
ncbi:MAG TPA: hypothetical protein VGK74_28885 [Symbiobacteriaceae bacterium]